MTLKSKEAKRLSQMKFKENEPEQIKTTPQLKSWIEHFDTIDKQTLKNIAATENFEFMESCDEYIAVYFSKMETAEECQERIVKQQREWEDYENRKTIFYADLEKRIQAAEDAEKLRKEQFNNPEYIEFLRMKAKFEQK